MNDQGMTMKRIKLGEICEVVSGSTPKTSVAEYWDGDINWITPAELTDETYIIEESQRKITQSAVQKTGLRSFPKGTVILSSRAPIGKVAIAGKEMYCNQGFKNLICSDRIDNKYLYWYLKGHTEYLNSLGRGATFKELSKSIVENIEILLPDLDEQIHCSNILKKCWDLISVQKKQIELYDKLIKSRFVEMFGVPTKNEKGFELLTVGDVVDFQGGAQPDKKFFEYEKTADNIRLIQIRDYKTDAYITYIPKSMAKRFCEVDDIMIGRYGPPIFQILKGIEGSYNVALMKAIPKKGNKEFIRHFLQQDCLLEYLEGLSQRTAGQAGIDMPMLKAYPLPYPPIDMQEMFAAFAKEVDILKSTAHQSLKKLQTLQKSLMQQYFT